MIRAPLIAVGTYAFVYAWDEYREALLLSDRRAAHPAAGRDGRRHHHRQCVILFAVSTVYAIPPVVLYHIFKRHGRLRPDLCCGVVD